MGSSLANKVFISTRPEGQNNELRNLLEAEGAKLFEMPTIEIQSSTIKDNDVMVFENIKQFSWIVFTSPNGIKYFFEILNKLQGNFILPQQLKIAVIGKKTNALLAGFGYKANLINPGNTSIEFGTQLMSIIKPTDHLLFPEGNLALGKLMKMLKLVAKCTSIVVYENKIPQTVNLSILDQIINNQYDQIIITSPSSFDNLSKYLNGKIKEADLRIACIGLTTASAVISKGIQPLLTAKMADSKGIFDEICEYYKIKNN